jgi:hypothetical protein
MNCCTIANIISRIDFAAFATVIMTIFTGCLVVCNIYLWRSTDKTADAAKRSAESLPIIERAYLFVEVSKEPIAGTDDWTPLDNNFKILVRISNYGKTPAILNNIHVDALWNEDYPGGCQEIKRKIPSSKNVLAPDAWAFGHVGHPIPRDLENINKMFLLCCGYIEYYDIWKVRHETGFCWEWDSEHRCFNLSNNQDLNYYT